MPSPFELILQQLLNSIGNKIIERPGDSAEIARSPSENSNLTKLATTKFVGAFPSTTTVFEASN